MCVRKKQSFARPAAVAIANGGKIRLFAPNLGIHCTQSDRTLAGT